MGVPIQDFLANRRNRALGSILGHMERAPFWTKLTPAEQNGVRTVVRDVITSYHDSVLDLVKAEDGVIRNEEVLALLERLDQSLRSSRRQPLPAAITG